MIRKFGYDQGDITTHPEIHQEKKRELMCMQDYLLKHYLQWQKVIINK